MRAGPLDRKETLLRPHPSITAAGRAGAGLGAGLGAGAGTGRAGNRCRQSQIGRLAGKRLFERDFEIVAQVRAARRATLPRPPRRPITSPKRSSKISAIEAPKPSPAKAKAAALLEGGMAEAIIGGTLLRIGEALIGLVDFLELDLAGRVAGIAVGMELHRGFAEGRFQFDFGARPRDAERFVIAVLAHCLSVPAAPAAFTRVTYAIRGGDRGFVRAASPASTLKQRPRGLPTALRDRKKARRKRPAPFYVRSGARRSGRFLVVADFLEVGVDDIVVLRAFGLRAAPEPPRFAPCTWPRRASSKPARVLRSAP